MNFFQGANNSATFLILGALVAGLYKHLDDLKDDPIRYVLMDHRSIAYLGLFMIVFRIKTALDDHRHFAEAWQDKTVWRYIGFILAAVSWVVWGFAAYELVSTRRAAELMAASIIVATAWVVVHLIEISLDPERRIAEAFISVMREKWVLLNLAYMACLVVHIGWLKPVVPAGSSKPLILLLVFLAFDVVTSRSFKNILTAPPPVGQP